MTEQHANDPLNFMRAMWGNMGFSLPGMVAPTFDLEELDKRIADMKAVEGWLRMNLSMLQMTIQGLEMQRTTLNTVQTMGQMAQEAARQMSEQDGQPAEPAAAAEAHGDAGKSLSEAALWPWQMMQQMREHMQQSVQPDAGPDPVPAAPAAEAPAKPKTRRSTVKK